MKSIKVILLAVFLAIPTTFAADSVTNAKLEKREQFLQESLARLEAQREQVRMELLALKQELTRLRQQETNQVIIVKIILPSSARPVQVNAEQE